MADGTRKKTKHRKGFYTRKGQAEYLCETAGKDKVRKAMGHGVKTNNLKIAINMIGTDYVYKALNKKKKKAD